MTTKNLSPKASSGIDSALGAIERFLDGMPTLQPAWTVLAVLHALGQLLFWLPRQCARMDRDRDLNVYFEAAHRAYHHLPLYQPWPHLGPDITPAAYLYPPQFAILLMPLGGLGFHAFCCVWYGIVLLGFWGFAWSLDKIAAGRPSLLGTLRWGLGLGLTPFVYAALSLGQADPVMWALFGAVIACRNRGLWLSLMAQVKPYGFLVAAQAAYREGKPVLVPLVAVTAIGFGLGILVFGVHSITDWIRWSIPLNSQGRFLESNVSLTFLVLRILHGLGVWHYHGGPLPAGPRLFLSLSGLIALALALYGTRKMEHRVAYTLVLLTAFLFSPTCWSTYLPTAVLLVAIAIDRYRRRDAE